MKSSWKKLEGSVGELTATFSGDIWTKAQDKAFDKIAKNVKLDGFRPGKAPKAFIKKRISDQAIYRDAIDIVLASEFTNLLKEHNVDPIAQPTLEIEAVDEKELKVKIIIPLKPEVTLGQYKDLDVKKPTVRVTQKEIQNIIERYRNDFAELSIKENGKVETGDTAVIDFEGFIDGIAFDGGKGENHPLEIGSNTFIPGFEDQLVGMGVEETKDITVKFPKDYQAEELAGKKAVFKVTVHEIKVKTLPELDDEFAKDVSIDGVETLKQLESYIKDQIKDHKQTNAENEYSETLFNQVISNSKVDVPDAIVNQEIDRMLHEIDGNLQRQGLDLKTFVTISGKTIDDIRDEIKDQAVNRVKFRYILEKIIEVEKLEVTEAEVDKEIENIASQFGKEVNEIKELFASQMYAMKEELLNKKAMDIIKGK